LITVPACTKCHSGIKLDEDYFRQVATMIQAASTGAGRLLWETKTRRAVQTDLGLRKAIIPRIESVDICTPSGVFVRRGFGFRMDWPRVNRFVEKCTRGLFYFETGRYLPPNATLTPQYFEDGDETLNFVVERTAHGKRRWPDVFDYRRAIDQSDPCLSLWSIRFYRGMAFGVSTRGIATEDESKMGVQHE